MNEKDLILVKLGGSLITDKSTPYTERKKVIDRLSEEIKEAKNEREFKLILGHGGGSYPHQSASKYQIQEGIINEDSYRGISEVHYDAAQLNRIVVSSLKNEGLNPISIQPSASITSENGEIKEWYLKPLKRALELDFLPVVYGDVLLDSKKGCCIISTEKLLEHLALKLGGKRIILCAKYNGVFTSDPSKSSGAKKIDVITPSSYKEIEKNLSGSDSADVTGGMIHKVKRCINLAKKGIDCEIISGEKEGFLKRALIGQKNIGTLITSQAQ